MRRLAVSLFVFVEITIIHSNLYDPHVRPKTGPFFEGWYMRMIDPAQSRSFGVLWGYVVPENPKSASKLEYIGSLRDEAGVTNRLQDYNAFPSGNDTKYTVKGGKTVTQDPDISSPASMGVNVKNVGNIKITQQSTNVEINVGDIGIKMSLGAAVPWHEDYTGPEGSVIQRLPLPLHWFVFSLHTPVISYTITDRTTGRIVTGDSGVVHMEKNWGDSFPESWIWSQGASLEPNKVAFALTYGELDLLSVGINAFLAGYRNYDKGISLDFTPVNSLVNFNYTQCGNPTRFSIQFTTPFYYRLNITVTAPQDSFSSCLFGPLEEGFRRVCQESFVGVAEIEVYEWAWFSGWKQNDHQRVTLAALEFGGKSTCQPCHS